MKKHLYMAEAERLYVHEQMPVAEIAGRLGVSEKTIRLWKEEGGWDEKRAQYLTSRKAFHEELYEFARALLKSVMSDFTEGKEPSPSRLFTLSKLLPQITKVKDYESTVGKGDTEPDMKEALEMILEQEYGIKPDK
jgi:hypothetical protein